VKTKTIDFSENLEKDTYPQLTPKMIEALLEAIEKQKKKIPFGPANIKGSLSVLIAKGLIIKEKITVNGRNEYQWQVTPEAITTLGRLGITT
jgi:predicted transcriptional regulator